MEPSEHSTLDQVSFHLRAALDGLVAMRIAGRFDDGLSYSDLADRLRKLSLRRAELIPETQFFDPSWNMLLDIYSAAATGRRLSVSAVCAGCGAPPTTALSYTKVLVGDGLAERVPDQFDGRRVYVVITDAGRSAIERWLDAFVAAFW